MSSIKAFVGHSFDEDDKDLVERFLAFFESLKGTTDFESDHAEKAEAKGVSKKVKEKMEGKNLFIGIFTKKDYRIRRHQLRKFSKLNYANIAEFSSGTSEWIIQESGYAIGKGMNLLFLVEEGVKSIQGLAGDHEYISFKREYLEQSFTKITQTIGDLLPAKTIEPVIEEKVTSPPKEKKGIEDEVTPKDESSINEP